MNSKHQKRHKPARPNPQKPESQISMVRHLLLSGLPHNMILMLIIAAVFPPHMLTALKK